MPRIDQYRHLNDDKDEGAIIGIEEIAQQVERLNYGTHRLLSAIVRARRARRPAHHGPDELADAIEAALNRGLF